MVRRMRILCVHQGYELYGSDRCFIESVAALRAAWPLAEIEVVLPRNGPIVAPLSEFATRITIEPMLLILRRRGLARLMATMAVRLPLALWRAASRMRRADLVLVNTMVVLDHLLVARFFRAKTIVHVHEIPTSALLTLFRLLLAWTKAEVIFNSRATSAAYGSRNPRQHIVYNGIAAPVAPPAAAFEGNRLLRLLLIGRINRIKGQDLLIEALARLPREISARLELRIVGGTFENELAREQSLHESVRAAGLDAVVRFEPFAQQPEAHYRWADVVVVPSRFPESLGRVAIEAMAHARPVLAARIGGLAEIVEHEKTGWLVPPNDAEALAGAILRIVTQPEVWRSYGAAARRRMEERFSTAVVDRQLQSIFRARLPGPGEKSVRGVARA
jgi:glycosyltransferase involved in cell wall biosynthesis